MISPKLAKTPAPQPALPGTWKLAGGRAMTLAPREPGVLRVAHGRLWVTCDGPHRGALNDSGDHILDAGAALQLAAGQRWVIEAWKGSPASFTWDPLPAAVTASSPQLLQVLQPLGDLRRAFALGAGALVRLAWGTAGLACELLGLPRIIPRWPGPNHPSTRSSAMRSWT